MSLEPYIDAHSHVWTPDVAHYPLAAEFQVSDMQPPSFTAEELLAICRKSGVGRVNLIQMSYYKFDNSYMFDMIKLYPDRFVGTAIIDPLGPDPALAMKGMYARGARAFRIHPGYSKQPSESWLRPEGYVAMFRTAVETGQVLSCLIDPSCFAELERMCLLFPDSPVIIDHLGRIGVGPEGKIDPADVDALCALAKHPKVSVKVGAFYALGKKAAPYLDLAGLIQRVVQAFGPNRCLWESDCPFQVVNGHTYEESIALVRDRLPFLDEEAKGWLLGKSAERLLFGAPG